MTEQIPEAQPQQYVSPPIQETAPLVQPSAPVNLGTIMLDLDTETRDDTKETFAFGLKGRRIVMTDPVEFDWQDLANLEDELEFVDLAMTDEDAKWFLAQKLPAWKMRKLMKDYQQHYGIEDPGKAA